MSHVGVPRGTARKRKRLPALLTAGVLTLPALAGCSSDGDETAAVAAVPQDVARAARAQIADGGKVTWAIDALPATLNAFQADADSATTRITGALLPTLFPLDDKGRPQLNPDYLESAKVTETEPRQVVVYRLNQQAVWSDGREIGAPDFVAQWRALSGKDSAFWTARNAGYERIEKIERGSDDLEVKVTFAKPYADWRSLFSPLYPKQVTGSPDAFNDGARATIKETAGPFRLREIDKKTGSVTLTRNPRWWGSPAKLDSLIFKAVKPEDRTDALAEGTVDVADVDSGTAHRIAQAAREGAAGASGAHGPGAALTPAQALRSWAVAHGTDEEAAEEEQKVRDDKAEAAEAYATEQSGLRAFTVRKALEPAYTQLALNGETGPLADDRVRRAVARALDRQELADTVLKPLGLPAQPLGSHLAVAGQPAYKDGSEALGKQDTEKAQALLADAGWTREGALSRNDGTKAGSEGEKQKKEKEKGEEEKKGSAGKESEGDDGKADRAAGEPSAADGLYIVGDDKPGDATRVLAPAPVAAAQSDALLRQAGRLGATGISEDTRDVRAQDRQPGGAAGAYAPAGTAAPAKGADAARGPLGKNGKPLSLRFVLPSGPGSAGLRSVGEKIAAMLDTIGIRTVITKVSDDSYFRDHVASGDYDMALYSWPASAYPATDDRPIYAKPVPATDGSLLVEQNYTRVGTDHIDQLFDQAVSELDEKASQNLMRQADARIWAAAGSIPLFQRPQLVATARTLVNVGAFGFGVPHYQDIGYKAPQAAGAPAARKK